jgi:outer membrane protein, multidrug efflux system
VHRRLLSALPLLALLAGCDVGPDYHRPHVELPRGFTSGNALATRPIWPDATWWAGFQSPELNRLIAEAQAHNFDLRVALAAVSEADATVRVAGGSLLPTVQGGAGASFSQVNLSGNKGTSGFGTSTTTNGTGTTSTTIGRGIVDTRTYSATLSAAYEVDFWGKNYATFRAAQASAVAARYAAAVTALTVVSQVANTWFAALAFQDQLDVARRNLAQAQELLAVEKGRLAAGTASILDVAQQAALVAGQAANIPNLISLEKQQVIALGILVGRPPEDIVIRRGTLTRIPSPAVVPGLPSELLQRRPDVAQAEATLVSATASTRAARAALFPSLVLTGSTGWESTALNGLFAPQSLVINGAASIAQTLFDNGALSGVVAENRAITREDLALYEKTVVQALSDVETALTQLRYATEQEAIQRLAVQEAELATTVARAQLAAGTVDITTLITAQQTQLQDENTLVTVRLARFQALVALFKALGGGWQQTQPETAQPVPILSPSPIP